MNGFPYSLSSRIMHQTTIWQRFFSMRNDLSGAVYGRGESNRSICMNWSVVIAGVLVLWSSVAGAATLAWNPNSESNLAGYRIYQCSLLPCTKSSGALLVTLGTGTSFNIGTPAVTQYYFITAFNTANIESGSSNVVT